MHADAAVMMSVSCVLACLSLQYPHELVTYGGNGQVLSNWAQVSLAQSLILVHDTGRVLTDTHKLNMHVHTRIHVHVCMSGCTYMLNMHALPFSLVNIVLSCSVNRHVTGHAVLPLAPPIHPPLTPPTHPPLAPPTRPSHSPLPLTPLTCPSLPPVLANDAISVGDV